jgi:hypothetical protein
LVTARCNCCPWPSCWWRELGPDVGVGRHQQCICTSSSHHAACEVWATRARRKR